MCSVCCHLNVSPWLALPRPDLLRLFVCAGREGGRDGEPKGDKHQLASHDASKGTCSRCTPLFALVREAPGGAESCRTLLGCSHGVMENGVASAWQWAAGA